MVLVITKSDDIAREKPSFSSNERREGNVSSASLGIGSRTPTNTKIPGC